MYKLAVALLTFSALLSGEILPGNVGPYHKAGSQPLPLQDQAVWTEYGLKDSEQAAYEKAGAPPMAVRAYRLQDATAALAAFEWQRPNNAKPANPTYLELSKLSAEIPAGVVIALGNHLLIFDGYKPTPEEIADVFRSIPRQESGPLPTLPDHLPGGTLQPNSERYSIGPASLAKFNPELTPSQAAFHFGTEIQTGIYDTAAGPMKLAILSFPSPEIARQRTAELEKLPGSVVKRSGPLVAAVFLPRDANAAERLLGQVRYQAAVTTGQAPLTKKDNAGNLMINIVLLVCVLVAFCVLSGLLFGGFRHMFRRGGSSGDGESMITLHLGDH